MSQRSVTSIREVTDVVPEQSSSSLPQIGMTAVQVYGQIMKQNAEAKILENTSKVQLDLNALTNQFQIENESSPVANSKDFSAQRKAIFDKYGADIPSAYKYQWEQQMTGLGLKNNLANQTWAIKQTEVNTKNSIKSSMENNFRQAYIDGQNFANSDGSVIDAMANFAVAKKNLIDFGSKNLGAETTNQLVRDYDQDSFKSFLSGMVEVNPQKAQDLLKDEAVQRTLDPQDMRVLHTVAKVRLKEIEAKNQIDTDENDTNALALVSGEGDYFDKRLNIDKMELAGQITPSIAAKARRVLTSEKNVQATTDNPLKGQLVQEMYDLVAKKDDSPSDFLDGIKKLKERVLDLQTDGKLSRADAIKVSNQMKTVTSAKLSQAAEEYSYSVGAANKELKTRLPPEYHLEGVRRFFDLTHDKGKLPREEQVKYANQVVSEMQTEIDQNNMVKRRDTLQKVDTIIKGETPVTNEDKAVLQKFGKNEAWLEEQATKRGVSKKSILDYLRSKK